MLIFLAPNSPLGWWWVLGVNEFHCNTRIDRSVKHVNNANRRIPLHLRKAGELEIKHLVDMDVIESMDGPTP